MNQLCTALPKAELHAHLHGCIRMSTLADLAGDSLTADDRALLSEHADGALRRSLSECFRVFSIIHKAVRGTAAVSRITREVLTDFAADNCQYVELRTTPRRLEQDPGFSIPDWAVPLLRNDVIAHLVPYVVALLSSVAEHEAARRSEGFITRVLLSINRTEPPLVMSSTNLGALPAILLAFCDAAAAGGFTFLVLAPFSSMQVKRRSYCRTGPGAVSHSHTYW